MMARIKRPGTEILQIICNQARADIVCAPTTGSGRKIFTENRFTAVRYDTNYALPLDTFWGYSADSTTSHQHVSLQADRAQTGDGYAFLCCEKQENFRCNLDVEIASGHGDIRCFLRGDR
jgi:hypothetical protein